MSALQKGQASMLNPVLTKFIQINTIYFSKSVHVLAPLGSIDVNKGIAAKIVDSRPAGQQEYEAIHNAQNIPNEHKLDEYTTKQDG